MTLPPPRSPPWQAKHPRIPATCRPRAIASGKWGIKTAGTLTVKCWWSLRELRAKMAAAESATTKAKTPKSQAKKRRGARIGERDQCNRCASACPVRVLSGPFLYRQTSFGAGASGLESGAGQQTTKKAAVDV